VAGQRADGGFKREVALKLPLLSRLRKDLTGRFDRERDILAEVEHPNIAGCRSEPCADAEAGGAGRSTICGIPMRRFLRRPAQTY
jgi:hypothetical protein